MAPSGRTRSRVEVAARTTLRSLPGCVHADELEGLAVWAWLASGLVHSFCDPLWLVHRHGIQHRPGQPPGCGGGQLRRDHAGRWTVIYRPQRPRAQGVAVLHEFAHWLLLSAHPVHDERDVWLLTLMLAFPQDELWRVCHEQQRGWTTRALLAHQPHAERWALALRAAMARAIRRRAA